MNSKYVFKALIFIVTFGLLGIIPFQAIAADTYQVDSVHSYVLFRIKHFDVGYSYGRFNEPTGSFRYDETTPSNNSIELQVNAKDVDTNVAKRDNHLRSPDFFDVEKYPLIAFRSSSVKKLDNNSFQISGNLSLLGKTRPITVRVRQTGAGKDPFGNHRRGFETTFTIKRSDFGMDFMMGALSDEVDLTVSLEGIRQ
jgi:polyisoprenoid-binding protein YceI